MLRDAYDVTERAEKPRVVVVFLDFFRVSEPRDKFENLGEKSGENCVA